MTKWYYDLVFENFASMNVKIENSKELKIYLIFIK